MNDRVNKALRKLIKNNTPKQTLSGIVDSVDESDYTVVIDPGDGGAKYNNVRLRSVINSSKFGFYVVPEKGSNVLFGILENNENACYLISCEKIKKLIIRTNSGSKTEFDENGNIVINDGNNGGLTITPKLQAELNKTNAVVNAIKNALTGWTPVTQDGGAALKIAASALLSGLQVGNFSQIENSKVKH